MVLRVDEGEIRRIVLARKPATIDSMKRAPSFVRLFLIAGLSIFCGCQTQQKYEDVSTTEAYRAYVGARYELKGTMHLSGVNAPPGYEQTVDYYVVNPASPSWSGPELITRDLLPPGTVIQVESVHRCTNCLFEKLIKAQIRLPNYRTQLSLPIHIPLQYLGAEFARKEGEPGQQPR